MLLWFEYLPNVVTVLEVLRNATSVEFLINDQMADLLNFMMIKSF